MVLLLYTVMPEYAMSKRILTDLCFNASYKGFSTFKANDYQYTCK